MIAIVMTYYDRQFQLDRTLRSIQPGGHELRVIVVDDNSPEPVVVPEGLTFPVEIVRLQEKHWTNPEPAYNVGIYKALKYRPDVLIIQNAECFHVGPVVEEAAKVTDSDYISFGSYSIDQETTFGKRDLYDVIRENNTGASRDGQNAWYNHPVHRPVGYDFCAAITTKNMIMLNGFDERFSAGMGYGDDYFLHRVNIMGLNVRITKTPFVVHQWHYNGKGVPENKAELVRRNRALFQVMKTEGEIKAQHIYTPNLYQT